MQRSHLFLGRAVTGALLTLVGVGWGWISWADMATDLLRGRGEGAGDSWAGAAVYAGAMAIGTISAGIAWNAFRERRPPRGWRVVPLILSGLIGIIYGIPLTAVLFLAYAGFPLVLLPVGLVTVLVAFGPPDTVRADQRRNDFDPSAAEESGGTVPRSRMSEWFRN